MSQPQEPEQTYSPWTVVNVVFEHLVDQGFQPMLGDSGHPGEAAEALLRSLGITPTAEGDARKRNDIRDHLAEMRSTMFDEP